MNINDEGDEGRIDSDTTLVNSGDYVSYAEVGYGPWTVEYERGREGFDIFFDQPATLRIEGPYIGGGDGVELHEGIDARVSELVETWDYVELAEEEVHQP